MLKFHHTGIIVSNLHDFESKLIFEKKMLEVFDPIQQAYLALYKNFGNTFLELIQPIGKESFTWNFIQKNGNFGYHHLCYEVNDWITLKQIIGKYRLITILDPIPALLFDGKMVTFFYTRNKTIVEFIILNSESCNNI